MVVKTQYIVRFYNEAHNEFICEYSFNSLTEVKQFMKKMEGVNIDGTDYSIKLYKRECGWDLSTGVVHFDDTRITQDF